MYAIYFVCYGACLVLTYVMNLSMRVGEWRQDKANKENSEELKPQREKQGNTSDDCQWSSWSDWSKCTVTCGAGVQVRHRTVLSTNSSNCSSGDSLQEQACSLLDICDLGNNYAFPPYSFLFDQETTDSSPIDDVINMAGPTDGESIDLLSSIDSFQLHAPQRSLPAAVASVDSQQNQEPSGNVEDAESVSFCSSFDCSSPDSPDSGHTNFWEHVVDDQYRHHDQTSGDGRGPAGEAGAENNNAGDFGKKFKETQNEENQQKNDDDQFGKDDRTRKQSFGEKIIFGDQAENKEDDISDGDHEKTDQQEQTGEGEDGENKAGHDEATGKEGPDDVSDGDDNDGDDDDDVVDEGEYDEDNEYDDNDEFETDEEGDKQSGEENRNRKRKQSIPEDEELDDKEEMEDEDEKKEKKRKRKDKRKRKKKKVPTATLR